jgi:hypothetical protein
LGLLGRFGRLRVSPQLKLLVETVGISRKGIRTDDDPNSVVYALAQPEYLV